MVQLPSDKEVERDIGEDDGDGNGNGDGNGPSFSEENNDYQFTFVQGGE